MPFPVCDVQIPDKWILGTGTTLIIFVDKVYFSVDDLHGESFFCRDSAVDNEQATVCILFRSNGKDHRKISRKMVLCIVLIDWER